MYEENATVMSQGFHNVGKVLQLYANYSAN